MLKRTVEECGRAGAVRTERSTEGPSGSSGAGSPPGLRSRERTTLAEEDMMGRIARVLNQVTGASRRGVAGTPRAGVGGGVPASTGAQGTVPRYAVGQILRRLTRRGPRV